MSEDGKYFGLYEAKVVDVMDTLKARRVQVRVHVVHKGITTGIPDKDLPWARPCFPFTGTASGDDGIPDKNAEIWVAFKHGDPKFPVWLGGYYPTGEGPTELLTAMAGNTPKGYFRKTPGGWFYGVDEQAKIGKMSSSSGYEMSLDETAQKATLKTASGHSVEIDEAGSKVTVQTVGGYKVELDETGQKVTVQTAAGDKLELTGSSGEALLSGLIKAILDSLSIELGAGATEPAIQGLKFITWLIPHTHNVTAIGSPTGPMIPNPSPDTGLSTIVKVK